MYCYNKQKYIGQNIIHDVRSEKMEKTSLNVLSGYVVRSFVLLFCRTNNRPKVKITSIQMLCVCVCKDVIIIVLYCHYQPWFINQQGLFTFTFIFDQ